jgi:hypothetical protein
VHRRLLCAALLTAAGLAGLAAPAHALTGEAACRADEVRAHNEAVFGHFSTLAAAKALRARAADASFKGIKIENEGCGDFEVEIDGADDERDRGSFFVEAQRAGYHVTFEQRDPPMAYAAGQVVGVFASKRTIAEAEALRQRLSGAGFRFIDIARVGSRWLVVMPQVPVKQALPIAHEVATAGFRIQFRSGAKS